MGFGAGDEYHLRREAYALVACAEALAEAWLRQDWPRCAQITARNHDTSAQFINRLMLQKLNVAALAYAVDTRGFSEAHLRRAFVEAGQSETPGALLNRLRMKVSEELLADRKLTIEAISCQMHFEDIRAFAKRFAAWPAHNGLSPRDYRAFLNASETKRQELLARGASRLKARGSLSTATPRSGKARLKKKRHSNGARTTKSSTVASEPSTGGLPSNHEYGHEISRTPI